jgi:hypothetical protein
MRLASTAALFQAWALFDPDATGQITTQKLLPFIRQLHLPLGAAVAHEKAPPERRVVQMRQMHRQMSLQIKQHRTKVKGLGSRFADGLRAIAIRQPPGETSMSGYGASLGTNSAALGSRKRRKSSSGRGDRRSVAVPSDRSVGTKREALKILADVRDHLHDRDGIVLYYDVYFALLHRLIGKGVPPAQTAKLTDVRDKQVRQICKKNGLPCISASAAEALAAVKLQSLVRARRTRKRAALAKAELAAQRDGSRPDSPAAAGLARTSSTTSTSPKEKAGYRAPLSP